MNEDGYAKLIGVPYSTLDCWGVVKEFYSLVFEIELKRYYDSIPYKRDIAKNLIFANIGEFEKVEGEKKFGDLILIKLFGVESHIAIFLGGGKILHTSRKTGCHIDSLAKWEKVVVDYYRVTND